MLRMILAAVMLCALCSALPAHAAPTHTVVTGGSNGATVYTSTLSSTTSYLFVTAYNGPMVGNTSGFVVWPSNPFNTGDTRWIVIVNGNANVSLSFVTGPYSDLTNQGAPAIVRNAFTVPSGSSQEVSANLTPKASSACFLSAAIGNAETTASAGGTWYNFPGVPDGDWIDVASTADSVEMEYDVLCYTWPGAITLSATDVTVASSSPLCAGSPNAHCTPLPAPASNVCWIENIARYGVAGSGFWAFDGPQPDATQLSIIAPGSGQVEASCMPLL